MEGEFYCQCGKVLNNRKYFCLHCLTIFCSKVCKEKSKKQHRGKCELNEGHKLLTEVNIKVNGKLRSFLIEADVESKLYSGSQERPFYLDENNKVIPICHTFKIFEIVQIFLQWNMEKLLDSVPENQAIKGKLFIFEFESYIDLVKKVNAKDFKSFFSYYVRPNVNCELLLKFHHPNMQYLIDGVNNGYNFLLVSIKNPIPFCHFCRFDLNGEISCAVKDENGQLIDFSGIIADKNTPKDWEYINVIEEEYSE